MSKKVTTCLYVAFNPAMPGWIKFGQSQFLEQRLKQLSSSSPVPFVFLYKIKIRRDWALKIESIIKDEFQELGHLSRAGIPKRSRRRSLEWISYGEETHHCRTEMVDWIKGIIRNYLTLFNKINKRKGEVI